MCVLVGLGPAGINGKEGESERYAPHEAMVTTWRRGRMWKGDHNQVMRLGVVRVNTGKAIAIASTSETLHIKNYSGFGSVAI